MIKNTKSSKAFSVIEILVVLAITAVLIGLSIFGMLQFRRVVEADQAVNDLVSVIKETKTRAKNNTVDTKNGFVAADMIDHNYGYFLQFDSLQVKRYTCKKPRNQSVWVPSTDCLTSNGEKLKKESFSNVGFDNLAVCDGILIENLTEKVIVYIGNSPLLASPLLQIYIVFNDDSNVNTRIFRKLNIVPATGDISIVI